MVARDVGDNIYSPRLGSGLRLLERGTLRAFRPGARIESRIEFVTEILPTL